jgi:hypothetical protein
MFRIDALRQHISAQLHAAVHAWLERALAALQRVQKLGTSDRLTACGHNRAFAAVWFRALNRRTAAARSRHQRDLEFKAGQVARRASAADRELALNAPRGDWRSLLAELSFPVVHAWALAARYRASAQDCTPCRMGSIRTDTSCKRTSIADASPA